MTDPREEVLDALLLVAQNSLRTLRNGSFDLSPYESPGEALFERLRALDTELGPPTGALQDRLERLDGLNAALLAEVRGALTQTEERLNGVVKGRRGMAGYLDASSEPGGGAKLGRG